MHLRTLLRYTKDKWSHTGFQKYFQNLGWVFFARIGSMVISFLATVYIVRHLGPTNYGELSYAISFVSLFSFLTLSGIDQVLYRDIIKHPDKKNLYMGSAFGLRTIGGLIAISLCTVFAYIFSEYDLSVYLIFLISLSYFFQSFQIINYEFQARVESKYPSIASLLIIFILNVLKVVVIILDQGVLYLALIYLLESILYAIFYVYIYKTKISGRILSWKFDTAIAKKLLSDSLPLFFSTAFILVYARIDQVMIRHMIDVSSVGLYDSAVRISEAWYLIPGVIVSSLFPAIINSRSVSEEQYERRLGKLGLLLLAMGSGVAITITFLAPFIINILYGAEFLGATIILQIYIWAGIGTSLSILANSYLIAENHRRILFTTSLVAMASNVVLNFLLIPRFGIEGAAWATLVSYSIGPVSVLCFKTTRAQIARILKTVFVF